MVNQEQKQVIEELISLGPISLFPKGIPGGFEIKTAQTGAAAGEAWVELEVLLTLQGQPPQEAIIRVYQAFSFSGGFIPTLDKKWRRWIRPESWTRAEIMTRVGDQAWALGRPSPGGTPGDSFTPSQPGCKDLKENQDNKEVSDRQQLNLGQNL